MKKWIHASSQLNDSEIIWELLKQKQVTDEDGFWTDYSLWRNNLTGEYATLLGDLDIYHPSHTFLDMEFDDEQAANDWFDHYEGEYIED